MSKIKNWSVYPSSAVSFWVQQAEVVTERKGDDALTLLVPEVSHLSDLFTTERPDKKYPDYFSNAKLLAAYGNFFLPQSFVRTSYALAQVYDFRGWRPPEGPIKILDLGSGPGSCGLSLAYHLQELGHREIEVCGVDHSPSALQGLEFFAKRGFSPSLKAKTRLGDVTRATTWPDEKFSIIVAGFVLNEIPSTSPQVEMEWIKECVKRLSLGGLLLILEPALRITAERLTKLSDHLVSHKVLHRLAPEMDNHPCPQLALGAHWCYEARPWEAPETTAFLNRKLYRDLREVRFSFAAFSNQAPTALPANLARVTSDVQIIKGLLRFITIRDGQVESVEVPTRGLSKSEVKKLANTFGRGDIVQHPHPATAKLRLGSPADLKVYWSANPIS
jgi:hypothetical protein